MAINGGFGRSQPNGHEFTWTAGYGSGGQRLFIVPGLDLVVVVNAFNFRHYISNAILNRFVMPAVTDYLPLLHDGLELVEVRSGPYPDIPHR